MAHWPILTLAIPMLPVLMATPPWPLARIAKARLGLEGLVKARWGHLGMDKQLNNTLVIINVSILNKLKKWQNRQLFPNSRVKYCLWQSCTDKLSTSANAFYEFNCHNYPPRYHIRCAYGEACATVPSPLRPFLKTRGTLWSETFWIIWNILQTRCLTSMRLPE